MRKFPRMALSVASHMGWPIECWDVSMAFLYARLFGEPDNNSGGIEIFLLTQRSSQQVLSGKSRKPCMDFGVRLLLRETECDNALRDLKWTHDKIDYRLLPCQGSPCLWTVVPIRPGEDPSVKTSREELTRGVVLTYVDDLLLTGWLSCQVCHEEIRCTSVLCSGEATSGASEGIDFLGARITRDADGTVKYIQHCLRENGFYDKDGHAALRKAHAPPSVDEKLGEEEGSLKEKNDAMAIWRKYIGQMMWLTTRTRPDIAACLGIPASLIVRRPVEVKTHLVCLWRYLWTTTSLHPAAVKAVSEPGTSQKADGLTKVLVHP